jgi:hypothetical protein
MKKTAIQPKTETKKSLFKLSKNELKAIHGGKGVIVGGPAN